MPTVIAVWSSKKTDKKVTVSRHDDQTGVWYSYTTPGGGGAGYTNIIEVLSEANKAVNYLTSLKLTYLEPNEEVRQAMIFAGYYSVYEAATKAWHEENPQVTINIA